VRVGAADTALHNLLLQVDAAVRRLRLLRPDLGEELLLIQLDLRAQHIDFSLVLVETSLHLNEFVLHGMHGLVLLHHLWGEPLELPVQLDDDSLMCVVLRAERLVRLFQSDVLGLDHLALLNHLRGKRLVQSFELGLQLGDGAPMCIVLLAERLVCRFPSNVLVLQPEA